MFRLLGVSYELQVSPIILMMQVLDITQEVRTAPWSNLRPLLLTSSPVSLLLTLKNTCAN